MFSSPLQRAIARGRKPDGDLADELSKLDDYTIRSRKDARAICDALADLPEQASDQAVGTSSLHALTALFQDVKSREVPAFELLEDEGVTHLIRIFDAMVGTDDERQVDDLLFVLKILAMYGTVEGAAKIVEAASTPLKPDGYMWEMILSVLAEGHPYRDTVFEALSDPLPQGFLAVALLDSANGAAIEDDLLQHPFDSPAGKKQLGDWLAARDPDHYSYAHSATAALPFVTNPERDQLLALAMDHVDASVQMEAAWAAAKLGRDAGLKMLARYCLDPNHSSVAQRYLGELEFEDLIPAEAQDPAFQAKAEFANWLAHPSELGQPPDELEIVDHRVLAWPPDGEQKPFWLIKYRKRDTTGLEEDDVDCGLVGSVTFCLFSYQLHQRPPEDAYAIYCCWELEHGDLIQEVEVDDHDEYAAMLGHWRGGPLEDVTITRIAELSHHLKYAGRLVALASATLDGVEGWVVLDGPRSQFYPKSDMPEDSHDSVVLKVHVGRVLLGFDQPIDRKKFLATDRPPRDPRQFVAAYDKLVAEAEHAGPQRRNELLGSWSLLTRYFDTYVESLMTINGAGRADTVIEVYGRYLELAGGADESIREDVYDTLSVLGEHFDEYADALVSTGRAADIGPLIELFARYWDNNLGRGRLGAAAFKMGQFDLAEQYLSKLRDEMQAYYRSDTMGQLAEVWHHQGKSTAARELLVDCIRQLLADIETSKYASDRQMFRDEVESHRATYLRLFPDHEAEMAKLGLPDSSK